MARRELQITLEGPFFQRPPGRTFRENIRTFMDRVAEVAQAEVQQRLGTGGREGASTRPHVVGRTRSLSGRRWACTARVSVSTRGLDRAAAIRRQAIAAGRHTAVTAGGRNIGTTLGAEGRTHAFRDSKTAVLRAARDNADLLLEGLR
jgi:hypothetical protein